MPKIPKKVKNFLGQAYYLLSAPMAVPIDFLFYFAVIILFFRYLLRASAARQSSKHFFFKIVLYIVQLLSTWLPSHWLGVRARDCTRTCTYTTYVLRTYVKIIYLRSLFPATRTVSINLRVLQVDTRINPFPGT